MKYGSCWKLYVTSLYTARQKRDYFLFLHNLQDFFVTQICLKPCTIVCVYGCVVCLWLIDGAWQMPLQSKRKQSSCFFINGGGKLHQVCKKLYTYPHAEAIPFFVLSVLNKNIPPFNWRPQTSISCTQEWAIPLSKWLRPLAWLWRTQRCFSTLWTRIQLPTFKTWVFWKSLDNCYFLNSSTGNRGQPIFLLVHSSFVRHVFKTFLCQYCWLLLLMLNFSHAVNKNLDMKSFYKMKTQGSEVEF